ncbi:MAG: carboxylating nicotinate-nucleotide diphosphorylase [Actinomycetota bacterium]
MKGVATEHGLRQHFELVAARALDEDLGGPDAEADVTTTTVVPDRTWAAAVVTSKAAGVVCGLEALDATYGALDPRVAVTHELADGDEVVVGDVVARVRGPARAILTGERSALNVMRHLSGIATLVRAFVTRAPGVQITETRKTTPGLRALEKYAVRAAGGSNHRFALYDGVLIKDNHIVAAGSVAEAVRRAKRSTTLTIEVECTSVGEVDEAIDEGADEILLDNLDPGQLAELVAHIWKRSSDVVIEASGNVTLDNVEAVAATGVDRISVGAFTHSAPALDLSLTIEKVWEEA